MPALVGGFGILVVANYVIKCGKIDYPQEIFSSETRCNAL